MFKTENFGQQCFTDLVSGSALVLTFWSLTVYLCVNVYDRTNRPRHSKSSRPNYVFICICNYVAQYVNELCYKILSLCFSYDMMQVHDVMNYNILC